MKPARIAVVGAGLIGRRHAEHVARSRDAELVAIVDPAPAGRDVADRHGVPCHAALGDMLRAERPDGVILATPNALHVEHGLEAVAAGVPALVEKPVAVDGAEGLRLVEAAERAGVPLLVGHHRRHNPLIEAAHEVIDAGRLGRIVSLDAHVWLTKPDDYFDVPWRRQPGAGPVFLNLIHDIDLLRHLCGEIVAVQSFESSAVRSLAVEDTAVVILRFAGGALGTVNVSDSIAAPWSWELTAGENPAYPRQDQACYTIGGTAASLSVPDLELWSHPGRRGWMEPMSRQRVPFVPDDPLQRQLTHFCAVIRGLAQPLVSGRDGLRTLRVIEAVKAAAATGSLVEVH